MNEAASAPVRAGRWWLLAVFLLSWNCLAACFASPYSLLQGYDGAQYQLLARNRLHGHDEVGDTAHTVRLEGRHPMWRPGLVWIIEGLAHVVGSVRLASGLASAVGTSFAELGLLWLAWRCFGRGTSVLLFFCLVMPLTVSSHFLRLAVGQGPEPWATAMILAGLAALVEARERRSWTWALIAGMTAGLSEWFRTGNLVLFAVPCAIYGLATVRWRDRLRLGLSAVALASFMVVAGVGGHMVPSPVDKTAANMLGNLVEREGLQIQERVPTFGTVTLYIGGLTLAPGTSETYYDHIVRRSHDVNARALLADRMLDVLPVYLERLGEVFASGAWGLRLYTGEVLLAAFLFQVILSLFRRGMEELHVLAFAGSALAYYFGPVILLRGDEPTHYLLVVVPLILLVGARGIIRFGQLVEARLEKWQPAMAAGFRHSRRFLLGLAFAPCLCLCASFYQGALTTLKEYQDETLEKQADLDALHLEGRKVACRSMCWFSDRCVVTVLLPYATVPELEQYVRAQDIDGILVWANEKQLLFRVTPYGSLRKFDRAMRQSTFFGPPVVSGGWSWYPRREVSSTEGKP
jgi:hypothetical protein